MAFISYLSLSFYVLFISRVLLKNLLSFFSFFLFFFLSLLGVMVGTGLPVNLRPKRESGLAWNLDVTILFFYFLFLTLFHLKINK
jgi:hypothetical protein